MSHARRLLRACHPAPQSPLFSDRRQGKLLSVILLGRINFVRLPPRWDDVVECRFILRNYPLVGRARRQLGLTLGAAICCPHHHFIVFALFPSSEMRPPVPTAEPKAARQGPLNPLQQLSNVKLL